MKKLFLFTLFISLKVIATPQISDILIYNGKEYEWNSYNPGRDYLEKNNFKVPEDAIETTANTGYYILTFTIENDSVFVHQTIRNSNIRNATKGLVVGIERNGERILNPESTFVFEEGDVVWIVGEKKSIDAISS